MNVVVATLLSFVAYIVAYRLYSRHLATRLFALDDSRPTPAHTLSDGVDYVPTSRAVLFGHHYASITGLAPMLGPAVAVIWGWLPALIWVVFGSILIGCVHDFSALVVSVRNRGMSIGKVAEHLLGPRAKTLFLLIILFGIALAMGVFVFVISRLFSLELAPGRAAYPQAVLPSLVIMVLAVGMGFASYRKHIALAKTIPFAFVCTLISVFLALRFPTMGLAESLWPSANTWTLILLGYAWLACVLPVWSLLQPRDFLNSLLLYLGLGLCYFGLFFAAPSFQSPALRLNPPGAPPLFPFVLIIIACGAVSGFHGLVSSGTTAKQLDKESDARPIGFGGMIGESLLGLLAVLACTAGFSNEHSWAQHYASWHSSQGLTANLDAFIMGSGRFVNSLGIPLTLAASFMAVIVVSFALTTLDSATRLLRYNLEEIGEHPWFFWLRNRYVASSAAVVTIAGFAFYKVDGKAAALALWELFGTTNQLLAGLTLLTVTLYLKSKGRNLWYTGLPTVLMLGSTLIAMTLKLVDFWRSQQHLLFGVGSVLLALAVWIVVEGTIAFFQPVSTEAS